MLTCCHSAATLKCHDKLCYGNKYLEMLCHVKHHTWPPWDRSMCSLLNYLTPLTACQHFEVCLFHSQEILWEGSCQWCHDISNHMQNGCFFTDGCVVGEGVILRLLMFTIPRLLCSLGTVNPCQNQTRSWLTLLWRNTLGLFFCFVFSLKHFQAKNTLFTFYPSPLFFCF